MKIHKWSIAVSALAALILLNTSCVSNNKSTPDQKAVADSNVSINTSDKRASDTLPPMKELNLTTAKTIEVLSLEKRTPADSAGENHKPCKAWSLTAKQIETLVRKFKQMTSEEQYLSYSFYDCNIRGDIKIDQVIYKYWIEAGGTLTLKANDTSFYYGCQDETSKKYFISGRLADKELQQ